MKKIFVIPFIAYLFFTFILINVQKPHQDEMIQPNLAINLIQNGYIGMPWVKNVIPVEYVPWWKGLDKHFYAQPPTAILTEALWFKIFGIGLLQLRLLAVSFGFIGLLSWFIILKKLDFNEKVIFLSTLLISIDFIYNRQATNGRLFDIMSASLAFSSWAVYLYLREKSLVKAIVFANTLTAIAGMTHPNGILGFCGLWFLIIYYDRKQLNFKKVLLTILPYLTCTILWGIYILQDLEAFRYQFLGNVFGVYYPSQSGFSWKTIQTEIMNRYLFAYGHSDDFPRYAKLLVLIIGTYFSSFVLLGLKFKSNPKIRPIFILTFIYFFLLMFLVSHKWTIYLCHITPLYAVCVAILWNETRNKIARNSFLVLIVIIALLSSGVNIYRLKRNEYRNKYTPDMVEIKKILEPNKIINAPLETFFTLGFTNTIADHTLCYYSKEPTQYIITDSEYEKAFRLQERENIVIYKHIIKTISKDYKLLFQGKMYKLYKKNS